MKSFPIKIVALILIGVGFLSSCEKSATSTITNSDYPLVSPAIMQSELTATDGKTFTLESLRGKVVLVNFWATWCGPCRAEMPDLDSFQKDFMSADFQVVGINADVGEDLDAVLKFEKEMAVSYPLVKSGKQVFLEFYKISQFDAIPQSFLIDREGRLRGVFVGGGPKAVNKMRDLIAKTTRE